MKCNRQFQVTELPLSYYGIFVSLSNVNNISEKTLRVDSDKSDNKIFHIFYIPNETVGSGII